MAELRQGDAPFRGLFLFEVDGLEIGTFTEVSGLEVEVQVEDLVEGGQNHFVHKLPRGMRWPNIVLKRGVTDSDNLFGWVQKSSGEGFAGQGDRLERTQGRITLLTADRQPLRSWEFEGAFPVKWTGPTLAASADDVATEELEIAHHGFRPSS